MDVNTAIKVQHVSKTFHEQMGARSFKQGFISLGRKVVGKKEKTLKKGEFTALKDINFEVKKGEFFGIVGRNGSGKSTLLKIIAGVYTPTKGSVTINGNLTPFIELGVGFNPELSGRDNVFLNGALLGFTRKQMEEMYDDIVEFAELKDFMEVKLKNYSSGMQVRLAFSVAIRAESDILLIDEVLAVGDVAFQQKCFEYFGQLKKAKKTVIFVSHDQSSLKTFCDRGVLIDSSQMIRIGYINNVVELYNERMQGATSKPAKSKVEPSNTGVIHLTNAKVYHTDKKAERSELVCIEFHFNAKEPLDNVIMGVSIVNQFGQHVYASNTEKIMGKLLSIKSGANVIYYDINDIFSSGKYQVDVAFAVRDIYEKLIFKKSSVVLFSSKNNTAHKHSICAPLVNVRISND